MIPYSAEAFLEVLAVYNQTVWPGQLTALFLSALLLRLLLFPRKGSNRVISGFLALGWLWTGLIVMDLHLIQLNWAARYFGIIFGIQGLLLIWSGLIKDRLRSHGDKSAASWAGLFLVVFALIIYPLGVLLVHGLASVQLAGLAPTPLTILTMGVLLLLQGPHSGPPARDPGRLVGRERCDDVEPRPPVGPFSLPAAGLATIFFSIARPRRAQDPAIRDRDYRRLFAGAAFHQQGMAGEQVVLGLLVIQLMGSSAWVGYTLAAYFTPFFVFGLVSGAITDWTDRRTLLRRIEIAAAATLAVFAIMLALGIVSIWLILAYCVCAGSLRAMHQPVRASYAYDLVGQDNLVSAMGLLNLGSRCGQLAGALVAGYVTENVGAAAAVWCLAGGHLTAFFVFRSLREAGVAAVKEHVPIRQNIREYIQELKVNRVLLMLLIVTAAAEVFGFSFATAFPEIVTGRLELGAEGLGLLQASRASAGVVAGIAFATLGARNRAGIIYLLTIAAFGAGLVCLAQASTLVTVLAAMFLASICAATATSSRKACSN